MEIRVHNLTAGARGHLALVADDGDRHELIARLSESLGGALLAYCLMETHVHVVAEGYADHVGERFQAALTRYIRAFNRFRGVSSGLLRGGIDDRLITDGFEVGRAIHYVHRNPVRVSVPLVEHAVEYRWSSQREFDGLSLAGIANVERALALLGPRAGSWLRGAARVDLADATPSLAPMATLGTLVAAAAQVHGVPWWSLAGKGHAPAVQAVRALLVRLGQLEGYSLSELASVTGRAKTTIFDWGAVECPARALRIARTLYRVPMLRRQLPDITLPLVDSRPRPNDSFGLEGVRARRGLKANESFGCS